MKEGDVVRIVSDICPVSGRPIERGIYTAVKVKFWKNESGKKARDIPYIKMMFLNRIKDDSPYGWVSCAILLPVEIEDLI